MIHDLGKPCEADWPQCNKGELDGAIAYLAGPIDNTPCDGIPIRKYIKSLAKEKGLKLKFLDPTDKFHGFTQDAGKDKENSESLRKQSKWAELRKLRRKIVRVDLRCVDISDLLILYIDASVHMCGSYAEFFTAVQQKKPIMAIIKGGKVNCPNWLFGVLDHHFMFDSVESCIDYLVKLNSGEAELNERWVLLRAQLKEDSL